MKIIISKLLLFVIFFPLFSFSQTYYVDNYGAVGDGVTDDKNAIQNAIWDLWGTGGTLYFTSGKTYIISEGLNFYNFSDTHNYLVTTTGSQKATVKIQDGAILYWNHWVFRLSESRNITIHNLILDGNRDTRNPTKEQSGISVMFIDGACDGTRLKNLRMINSPSDNVYIVVHENSGETMMTDFEMHNCILENAYRNNMSIISGENFKIIGCEFNNANGTDPQSGIDFEPNNNSANGYKNITVEGCKFKNNVRYGIETPYILEGDGYVVVKNNYFENNGILIGSRHNQIHHNIFVKQNHQHLHGTATRDGIIYFHSDFKSDSNSVYNNYLYNNPMPAGSHLVNFMYNAGGSNHLHDNYGFGNTVSGFVLNNTNPNTPAQIISNNVFINRKEMGYWSMDSTDITGNNIDDLSYFENDGTLVNSPVTTMGKNNQALNFAPDNKYISIDTNNNLNIEINITLSAWIKWNGVSQNETEQVFLGRGSDWKLGVNNLGQVGFYAPQSTDSSFTGGWVQAGIDDSISVGEWTFVTFTYDGSMAKLFLNAQEVATKQANGELGISFPKLFIGSLDTTEFSFNGCIDEVKIFNYPLDIHEIAMLRGVNYYVDFTSGDNSKQGTSPSTAWKTIDKVNAEISHFAPGDSILFKRGETWTGSRLNIENVNGSDLADIFFGAYGTGAKPVINAIEVQSHTWSNVNGNIWKATNPPANYPERMLIDGVEKLRANIASELDGVTCFWRYDTGSNDLYIYYNTDPNGTVETKYATGFPVIIGSASHITLGYMDLQGGWTGIYVSANSDNITIYSMQIGKYSSSGIDINTDSNAASDFPANITVKNCDFDAFFTFDYSGAGAYQGTDDRGCSDGIFAQALDSGEIHHCQYKNWGHASINIDGGANTKVSGVKVYENFMTSPDICYGGRIAVDDAVHCEIYNNEIVNTSVQSQLNGQNNHYHHNIFRGTKNTPLVTNVVDAGVELQGYSNSEVSQNIYEHNLFVDIEGPGFRISGNNDNNVHDNVFRNNIIFNCGTTISGKSLVVEANSYGVTADNSILNNDIYNENTTQTCDFRGTLYNVAGFNAQTGTDGYLISANIADNPLFADAGNTDFHLTTNSPCINSGVDALAERDFDNVPVPLLAKPDMGVYEYGVYWTGSICDDWHTAGNWSSGQVPLNIDKVTIPSPEFYRFYPQIKSSSEIKALYLNKNSRIIIKANSVLTVTN